LNLLKNPYCHERRFVVLLSEKLEVGLLNGAYLILENGAVFKGRSFGYDGEAVGELVFTTGMTGYLETLSDPAYFGQIVLQTFPLIGNYGVIPQDFGPGPVHLKAYIVRDWCQEPSNFRSEGNLDSFLREIKTPGLYGIDTRRLTRMLRESGVMNAMVSKTPELDERQWAELRGHKITGAVEAACAANAEYRARSDKRAHAADPFLCQEQELGSRFRVVVWDFGCASRIAEELMTRRLSPAVSAFNSTASDILAEKPDGVVLSGGPGDPAENAGIVEEIRKLCEKGVPIFATGLGHQLLALARGAKTEKLPFGHRGANQAVRETCSSRAFVSMQNHGYVVKADSLPETAEMSFVNVNDGTCEGIEYTDIPAFSVQFDATDEELGKFIALLETRCG